MCSNDSSPFPEMSALPGTAGPRDLSRKAVGVFRSVLSRGADLRVRVTGQSMSPFLSDGDVVTLRRAAASSLNPGDLVLFVRPGGVPRIHRLIGRRRAADGSPALVTRGDALRGFDDPVPESEVLARVVSVETTRRGGRRRINLDSPARRLAARLTAARQALSTVFYYLRLTSLFCKTSPAEPEDGYFFHTECEKNMEYSIEVRGLCKSFPRLPAGSLADLFGSRIRGRTRVVALDRVDLTVRKGELLVLMGPNGSGKTTLLKVLSTLVLPDSGGARVNGRPLRDETAVKRAVGFVGGDERSFFWRLSVDANLRFFASLHDLTARRAIERIRELAGLLGFGDFLPRRFDTLPSGIKQRVSLARALLHDPPILLLDEPTKSLDPAAARGFRDAVRRLVREEGRTVVWVTHRPGEAGEMGGRIATMAAGRLSVAPADHASGKIAEARPDDGDGAPPAGMPHRDREGGWARGAAKALAFVRKDLLTSASYRFAFALRLLGIVFSISIFYFISRVFDPAAAPLLAEYGGGYFPFVLVGLAFSGYLYVALSSFGASVRQGQMTGTLEAVLATPTPLATFILCSGLWNFLFTSLRVVLYLALGAALFGVNLGQCNIAAALLVLALTILSFAALGIVSASFVMVFKKGDPLAAALGSASALLGGVYFPVAVLPAWLGKLSLFLPITYSLRAMRLALLRGEGIPVLWKEIAVLGAFAALLCPISLLAFRGAVRFAKRNGSLLQY